jgi:tape measure domain-containing protein
MTEGNVQLKLQASLDLAFLRAQVASLGKSLKTGGVSVVATLDTKQLQKDVAKLGKEIRIKINDKALDATVDRIKTVEARLKNLQSVENKVVVGVTAKSAVTQKDARKVRSDVYRSIMQSGGKIMLPVGLQPISQTAVNAFKADLQKKLGSVNIKVNAAVGAMPTASQAGASRRPSYLDAPAFKTELEKLSRATFAQLQKGASGLREGRTRTELERLLSQFAQTNPQGAQRTRDLNALREMLARGRYQQGVGIEARMANGGGQSGQFQRTLDTFARGLFRMLGMDPARLRAEQQARRILPAINWQAQTPQRNIPIGPSSTGRALPGAPDPALLPGTRLGGQAVLPVGRRGGALAVQAELADFYRTVEVQVRNTFDIIADYHARSLRSFQQSYQQAIATYHRNLLTAAAGQGLRPAQVVDFGNAARPAIAPGRIAGLLPSSVGRTPQTYGGMAGDSPSWQERAAARTAQAYARSALRGIEFAPPSGSLPPFGGSGGGRDRVTGSGQPSPERGGQIVPYGPRTELPSGYLAGGQMAKALRDADQYLRQARVPLAGAIEELGGEFAQATKQVLLYGTAYKALAFFMDLPNQTLRAATALQTFRNQLNAVTGSAEGASRSFGFIDGLANQFSVPLESIRQGFIRMYASMEPAGFGAQEIEGLFSGISKAAATFGMSRDQVDRVTYAFSQMASKGQIMAEELRGQLGDVLPGSLALFAEAAQMSIPDFTKAMEDGRFSGEAMRVVLNNVAILLNTKFARGAQGAAKTLQGSLNQMQNSLQRLYEAFEPLVGVVAQNVFPLVSAAVADATAAIKAFTVAAQGGNPELASLSASGQQLYAVMQQVVEIGRSAGGMFQGLMPTLGGLGKILLFTIEQLSRFINTPVGGYLANIILQTTLFTAALQLLARAGLFVAVRGLVQLIFQTDAAIWRLKLLIATSRAARFAVMGLGAAVVVSAVMTLADAFGEAGRRVDELRSKTLAATNAIRAMSTTEAIQAGRAASADIKALQAVSGREDVSTRQGFVAVNAEEKAALERAGIGTTKQVTRGRGPGGIVDVVERSRLAAAMLSAEGRKAEADFRVQQNRFEEQRPAPDLQAIPSGEAGAGGASAADKAAEDARKEAERLQRERERSLNQQQDLITKTAEHENKLAEIGFDTRQMLAEDESDARKSLIDSIYDYELAGANEIMAVRFKLEKRLSDIRLGSIKNFDDALRKLEQGRLNIAAARRTRAAAGEAVALHNQAVSSGAGLPMSMRTDLPAGAPVAPTLPTAGAYLQGNIGPTSTGPHFDVKRVGGGFFPRNYLDQFVQVNGRPLSSGTTVPGGTFAGHQRRGSHGWDYAFGPGRHAATLMGGAKWMEGKPTEHGERRRFQLPTGEMFQFLHGTSEGLGLGGTAGAPMSGPAFSMAKREQSIEFNVEEAEAEQKALVERLLSSTIAELTKAREAARTAVAEIVGEVMPVEQLKLENDLLARRGQLMLQAVPDEVIEFEENRAKALAQTEQIQQGLQRQTNLYKEDLEIANAEIAKGGENVKLYEELASKLKLTIAGLEQEQANLTATSASFNLELAKGTLTSLQNADALNKVREAVETVERAVGDAMGSYKNFLVNVARGEGLTKSLKEFQNALRDQALTLFFDFAMKPMQKFMEDSLKSVFGLPIEDQIRQEQIRKLQEQIQEMRKQITAIDSNTRALDANTRARETVAPSAGGASTAPSSGSVAGQPGEAPSTTATTNEAASLQNNANNLNKIAEETGKTAKDAETSGNKLTENLGKTASAVGIASAAIMGITAGIAQIKEGGTGNVLSGIGSIALSIGSALGSFNKLFAADGGIAYGGWKPMPITPFANGGLVNGPTLGLVGEGKYNEAIVPLPDGRSIPVKVAGGPSPREAMANGGMPSAGPSVMSFSFETTKINGVEYVSRDQLELAMAATRKEAVKEGAKRGMDMTMDKIRNSPAARQSIAMGRR